MVIDIHCHAGTAERLQAPWTTRADLSAYLERAEEAGIDKTVVFAITSDDYERANAEVAEIVARHTDKLIGFARIHPERDKGKIERLLRRAVEDYGFRGIKVHGGEALPTREVCEVAKSLNLPILVDIMGRVEVLPLLAAEFPEVNFIVAHLGSFADDWRVFQVMPFMLPSFRTFTLTHQAFGSLTICLRQFALRAQRKSCLALTVRSFIPAWNCTKFGC